MKIWHLWILAGIIFMILEIFTSGFVVGVIGLGCFAAALAHLLGGDLTWQVGALATGTLVGFIFIRPVFLHYFYAKDKEHLTNAEALMGKTGMMVLAVDRKTGQGRVRIDGSDWNARSATGAPLAEGVMVKVVSISGATAVVEPIQGE